MTNETAATPRSSVWWAAIAALTLASCGRPDASGVYLSQSDRETALVQIVQARDGTITGRIETFDIGPGGVVNGQTITLDGAASRHDLLLKPTSAWFGGSSATGRFTRDSLTLSHAGRDLQARRASPDDYQKAVARLQARATTERRRAAEAGFQRAEQQAQATTIADAADKNGRMSAATVELRNAADRLNRGVEAAPDYGRQAADNTAKIEQLARLAASAAAAGRGPLGVQANQVRVATDQIEAARSQYAIGLEAILQQGSPVSTDVLRFCDSAGGAPFAGSCGPAKAAATSFQSALVRAVTVFRGYKQTIQTELLRQGEIAKRIGG